MKDVWYDGYFCLPDTVPNRLERLLMKARQNPVKTVDVTVGGCLNNINACEKTQA